MPVGHVHPLPDSVSLEHGALVEPMAVGNAAVRNRVKRRLRHQAREHVTTLPGSAVLVVRALPAAAQASYEELATDLARSLQRVMS